MVSRVRFSSRPLQPIPMPSAATVYPSVTYLDCYAIMFYGRENAILELEAGTASAGVSIYRSRKPLRRDNLLQRA